MKRNTMRAAEMLAANGWNMEKTEQIGTLTRLQYTHDEIPGLAIIWEDNSRHHIAGDELRYVGVTGLQYMHTIDLDGEVITW